MVYETQEGEPVTPARPLVMSSTDEWLARISDQLEQLLNPSTGDDTSNGGTGEPATVLVEEPATPAAAPAESVAVEEPQPEKPKRRLGRGKN